MRALFIIFNIVLYAIILLIPNPVQSQEVPHYAFRFPMGGRLVLDPVIDTDRVWLLAEGSQLYVVTENGVAIGKGNFTVSKPAYAIPDKSGRIFISDGYTQAALYNENCKLIWSIKFNGKLEMPPLFDSNGMVYLAIGNNILCYTPGGRLRAHFSLPAAPYSACITKTAESETIFFVIRGQEKTATIISISLADFSATNWEIPQLPSHCAISSKGAVFSIDGTLLLFSKTNEQPLVLAKFASSIIAMDFDGTNGAVLLKNNTLCFIAEDTTTWSVQTKADPDVKVLLTSERIILYNKKRALSFSLAGELYREINITNSTTNLIPGNSGVVFSGGEDWILYAYQFENFNLGKENKTSYVKKFSVNDILASEIIWFTAGYSDTSFLPYLDRAELALQKLEPLSQADYAIVIVAAASVDVDKLPDPQKNLSIPLRVRACTILGADGNPASIPWLLETVLKEKDEALVAAALNAIADIGFDPHAIVLNNLAQNFTVPLASQPALALIRCITNLTLAQGIQHNKLEALSLLTKLQNSKYPVLVRKKAQEAQLMLMRQ